MCDNETFKYNVWQWDKYNVWQKHFKLQCVTQWDILNTMCDNETFKYNVWQWDI